MKNDFFKERSPGRHTAESRQQPNEGSHRLTMHSFSCGLELRQKHAYKHRAPAEKEEAVIGRTQFKLKPDWLLLDDLVCRVGLGIFSLQIIKELFNSVSMKLSLIYICITNIQTFLFIYFLFIGPQNAFNTFRITCFPLSSKENP